MGYIIKSLRQWGIWGVLQRALKSKGGEHSTSCTLCLVNTFAHLKGNSLEFM